MATNPGASIRFCPWPFRSAHVSSQRPLSHYSKWASQKENLQIDKKLRVSSSSNLPSSIQASTNTLHILKDLEKYILPRVLPPFTNQSGPHVSANYKSWSTIQVIIYPHNYTIRNTDKQLQSVQFRPFYRSDAYSVVNRDLFFKLEFDVYHILFR